MRWSVLVRSFCRTWQQATGGAISPLEVLRMPNYQREHLLAAAQGQYDVAPEPEDAVAAAEQRRDRARFLRQQIQRQRGQG